MLLLEMFRFPSQFYWKRSNLAVLVYRYRRNPGTLPELSDGRIGAARSFSGPEEIGRFFFRKAGRDFRTRGLRRRESKRESKRLDGGGGRWYTSS